MKVSVILLVCLIWGCGVDNGRTRRIVTHVSAIEGYAMADTCVLLYTAGEQDRRFAHIETDTPWMWADYDIAKRYPGKTFLVYGPRHTEYLARWLPEVVIMDGGATEWIAAGFRVTEDTTYARKVRWEAQWQREMNNWWWGGPPPSWIQADGGQR